jgi:hypothetical protein
VVGLWPGRSLHARKTLENPRWEDLDFDYENKNGEGGKECWNGWVMGGLWRTGRRAIRVGIWMRLTTRL